MTSVPTAARALHQRRQGVCGMTRTITQAAGPHPRGTGRSRQLWCSLPTELARRFRPHADPLARRILEEVQRAVPEYAKPLEGEFGKMIVLAIEQAVLSCIDSIDDLASTQDNWAKLFV